MSTFSCGEPPVALDVVRETEAAQKAPRLALLAPRRKALDVGRRQCALEGLCERAAVDCIAKGVGHRHRLGGDHVDAPQLGAVETALPGRLVDQPLDDVDRLGKARTAGDADRRRIGQHGTDLQLDCRDAIDCAGQMGVLEGLHTARTDQIGPGIGGAVDAQRQKAAIGVERQGSLGAMIARLMVGQETLAAGGDPFDRAADAPRRPQDQHMLGIDEILRAEAAADIGRDKSHCSGRHTQCTRGIVARRMNALARNVGRVPAAIRIPKPNDAARLHRVGDDPVIVEIEFDEMCRGGKSGSYRSAVAGSPIEAEIARHFGRNLGRSRRTGGCSGRHRRQRAIVDHDLLGGVERLRAALGDNQRDRLADIADLARRQ